MVNDLLRVASKFYKLSQDPLVPVKAAIEEALAELTSTGALSINTVSLIGGECKVDIQLHPTAGDNSGSTGGLNQSYLQKIVSQAVTKVNPALKTIVTINLSSETVLPRVAQLRKNFAKFHKLAQKCQTGDPLCDDLGAGLPPDEPSKPAPAPAPKPAPKPDTNKSDDGFGAEAAAQKAIVSALQASGLGMRGFTFHGQSKQILVEVGVPREKKISTKLVNEFLTQQIMSIAPGFTVITTLSTT